MFALNNAEVKTFGKCVPSIDISLKGYPRNDWSFVATDSNIAILGADFLFMHNWMIDQKSKQLIEQENYANEEFNCNVKFGLISKPVPEIVFKDQCTNPALYCELVNNYPNLLSFNAPASNAATDNHHTSSKCMVSQFEVKFTDQVLKSLKLLKKKLTGCSKQKSFDAEQVPRVCQSILSRKNNLVNIV